MSYIGPSHHLAFSDIGQTLVDKTEVGRFGDYPRFRPGFYAFRVVESWLWGDRSGLWYADRVVMLACFLAALYLALGEMAGVMAGIALVLYSQTSSLWSDVWPRLGASESYGAFGTALILFGAVRLVRLVGWDSVRGGLCPPPATMRWRLQPVTGHGVCVALGLMIAAGAKESFLILAPFVLAYAAIAWHRGRLGVVDLLLIVAGLALCGTVALSVILSLSKTGLDFYGNSASMGERAALLGTAVTVCLRLLGVPALAGAGALALIWWRRRRHGMDPRGWTLAWLGLLAAAAVFIASQVVFYNGNWPGGAPRYDFPGTAVPLFVWAAAIGLWTRCARLVAGARVWPGLLPGLVTMAACIAAICHYGFPMRAAAAENVERSRLFSGDIARVAAFARQHPDRPIIVETEHPLDNEPVFSIGSFLWSAGVQNPMAIRYTDRPDLDPSYSPFFLSLQNQIMEMSRTGVPLFHYTPLTEALADPGKGCIAVVLSGTRSGRCDCFVIHHALDRPNPPACAGP